MAIRKVKDVEIVEVENTVAPLVGLHTYGKAAGVRMSGAFNVPHPEDIENCGLYARAVIEKSVELARNVGDALEGTDRYRKPSAQRINNMVRAVFDVAYARVNDRVVEDLMELAHAIVNVNMDLEVYELDPKILRANYRIIPRIIENGGALVFLAHAVHYDEAEEMAASLAEEEGSGLETTKEMEAGVKKAQRLLVSWAKEAEKSRNRKGGYSLV